MTDRPLIIGLDGGATKVSAWDIGQSVDGFHLGKAHSQKTYSDFPHFDPGFTPVNIQTQLKEMDSTINPIESEQNQGQAIIGAFTT